MRPLLKFCGNHSYEDLKLTASSKADFIGFIFTEKSRRTVSAAQAAGWLEQLGTVLKKKMVGVFANDSLEQVKLVTKTVPLDIVQLHGSETPRQTAAFKQSLGLPVWKALHHGADTLQQMRRYNGLADGFVIDTKVNGQLGGTGVSFDWTAVPDYMREAKRQRVHCLIAGGVTPDNIDALLNYQPMGIDLASGIERAFHKDSEQIRKIEEKVWMNRDQTTSAGG